jgi:aryl-alcohol dehydrogenase-like predicted oxidoreductase
MRHGQLSRRVVLGGGLLAGLSALLPNALRAADTDDALAAREKLPLITKAIPSTGERIPAIGLGCNSLELDKYPQMRDLFKRMQELGGTIFDTSSDYDNSEEVIGRALAELGIRKQMFISTKCSAKDGWPRWISSLDRIEKTYGEESFVRSLQRLQTNYVDLMFSHHIQSIDGVMPKLLEWKAAGRTRYTGIATFRWFEHPQLMEKMRQYPVDFIQVDYSIGNREAADDVLQLAAERKIAVMVIVPLKFRADWGSHGDSLLPNVAKVPLPPWAADIDVTSWPQFILKYAISHPAVTCVVPGTTTLKYLVENQLAGRGRLPDAAMRKEMEKYWDAVS